MKLLSKSGQLLLIISLLIPMKVMAQSSKPINSNYLFEQGVSPRILDIAASDLLQDGSFSSNVVINVNDGSSTEQYKMQVIYDPTYEEGMDVRIVF